MKKISVVTICFNESRNIIQTMLSVVNQTYKNIEYIIKDGMSTDNTNEIISNFILYRTDTCIKHLIKKDTGIYDAMNQAIDICTGDWIIFINAGDQFISANVLENIFDKKIYESDILYGDVMTQDISGKSIWKANITKMPYKMPFSHQACFIKTELLQKMYFNLNYKIAADYELLLRCYEQQYQFENINCLVALFSLDGVSSTNYVSKMKEQYTVWKDHELLCFKLKIKFPFFIVCAWVKGMIDQYMPVPIQIYLRRIYKHYFKRYKKTDDEYEVY